MLSDSRGATTSAARWNGEVDVVFINNRTCDRVRRCCPFVAPEPIVIKIFYALLQAASERLPQQQEPPLVGFGISSRVRLDTPSLLPSSRLHLGLDCVFAVGKFLFSMQRYPTVVSEPCLCIDGCTSRTQWFVGVDALVIFSLSTLHLCGIVG